MDGNRSPTECTDIDTTKIWMPSESRHGAIGYNFKKSIPWYCFLRFILPIVAHLVDMVLDIYLTIGYFTNQKTTYGCITLTFIVLPGVVSLLISSMINHRNRQFEENEQTFSYRRGGDLFFSVVNVLFDMRLLRRYLQRLTYAWNVKNFKKLGNMDQVARNYEKLEDEIKNLSILCLVPSFIENVPQQIMQLTIMIQEEEPIGYSMSSRIIVSFFSLIFVAVDAQNYYLNIHSGHSNGTVISKCFRLGIFLQCYITIVGWICLITFIAYKWPVYILLIVVTWMIWTIYFYKVNSRIIEFNRRNKTSSLSAWRDIIENSLIFFCCVFLALVHMFTFLDFKIMSTWVTSETPKVQMMKNLLPFDQEVQGGVEIPNRESLEGPEFPIFVRREQIVRKYKVCNQASEPVMTKLPREKPGEELGYESWPPKSWMTKLPKEKPGEELGYESWPPKSWMTKLPKEKPGEELGYESWPRKW